MKLLPDVWVLPAVTISGAGTAARLLPECAAFGQRGFWVHGRSLKATGMLDTLLRQAPPGLSVKTWEHPGGEPTLAQLDALLAAAREHRPDWMAGVGGGSVLDVAKACAGLYHGRQATVDYHNGTPVEVPGLPFTAVPTTAGTGSEATVNAVLTNTQTGEKKSIRHPFLMPQRVILDPLLLAPCPRPTIACSGLDALTQAIEAYVSRFAVELSDGIALKAVELIAAHVESVYRGADVEACGRLLEGSYLAGMALNMARLGIVHGLAHPLGARYHVPHGQVCGLLLPYAIEFNRPVMGDKYQRLSQAVQGDLLAVVQGLLERMHVDNPFKGQSLPDWTAIIKETLGAGSTAANPRDVTAGDVHRFLDQLFGGRWRGRRLGSRRTSGGRNPT